MCILTVKSVQLKTGPVEKSDDAAEIISGSSNPIKRFSNI